MKILVWLIFLTIIPLPTLAQSQNGTVGVVYYAPDKIIVAADSRVTRDNGDHFDNQCKIAVLDGLMVFVSAGLASHHSLPNDVTGSWSNIDEVRQAYSEAYELNLNKGVRIVSAATKWENHITAHLQTWLQYHGNEVREFARKLDGTLTTADFAGFDENGKPILIAVKITLEDGPSPRIIHTYHAIQMHECPRSYCAIGHTEIVREFAELKSERAKREVATWKPLKDSDPADYDILGTMRLVELTIQYHDEDIGGPVDAVQLNKDGTVRWFKIKDNCKQN